MNVIQEQIPNNKGAVPIPKPGGLEKCVMGPPRRPFQSNIQTITPAAASTRRRALTSGCRSSSSYTRSASSHPIDATRNIVAISEGRGQARGTVGIAAIDIDKPTLILCQIADVQSYTNTLTKLNVLRPTVIIVPSTFVECVPENRLLTALGEHFLTVPITSVPRSEFNNSRGLNQIRLLCASAYESVLLTLEHKFYASAAAAALLRYIERAHNVVYCSHSIRVEHQEPEELTVIDVGTADRLELVMSRASSDNHNTSLLSVLDHCVTSAGKRLLRATVLQPPCRQQIVESRLDCVSELLADTDFLTRLRAALTSMADVDQSLMLGSVMSHTYEKPGVTERQLNYVLLLRSSLVATATLHEVLASARHPVMRAIHARLSEAHHDILLKLIGALINDDAHPARGHSGDMQRCFAIRAGFDGLLDVARKTYTEIIDDMRSYVDRLAEKHSLPLRLSHNSRRRFHIIMKSVRSHGPTILPIEFVQLDRGSTNITMTTSDLVNCDLQLRAASEQIMRLSGLLMHGLLQELRPHVARLYQLCDDVALLDKLQSLAVASAVPGLVRPCFSAFMRLKSAKHPLLERICPDGSVANPALAHPKRNCHLITGPNMSGKSVYVRQLVLTQIMAQVGCYIQAEAVTLRLCDRVYAIVGREDYIESGASSFVKEMREVRYLLDTLTDRSLVVMDELCRATSCDEGTSIARAILEHLLHTNAFIFIATHYLSLTTLADEYPNVTNWHMETLERQIGSSGHVRLTFTHRLLPGVTPIRQYGLKLAKLCGSTNYVADLATQLLTVLMPAIEPDQLHKNRTKQIAYLRHELEANMELLELEKQLTPELRQKAIAEFEQKTGETYQPSFTTPAPSKDTPSVTSAEIQRVILPDTSSSIEELRDEQNRTKATSSSCSEMNVDISDLQPCDPLGNILKCGSNHDGSSEWTLPARKTKTSSPFPGDLISPSQEEIRSSEQYSLPMRIVAVTYSSSDNDSFVEPPHKQPKIGGMEVDNNSTSVLDENRFTCGLKTNRHKTSTPVVTNLFETANNPKSNACNLNNFHSSMRASNTSHFTQDSKLKDIEKDSCYAANISSSISSNMERESVRSNVRGSSTSSRFHFPVRAIDSSPLTENNSKLNLYDFGTLLRANNASTRTSNSTKLNDTEKNSCFAANINSSVSNNMEIDSVHNNVRGSLTSSQFRLLLRPSDNSHPTENNSKLNLYDFGTPLRANNASPLTSSSTKLNDIEKDSCFAASINSSVSNNREIDSVHNNVKGSLTSSQFRLLLRPSDNSRLTENNSQLNLYDYGTPLRANNASPLTQNSPTLNDIQKGSCFAPNINNSTTNNMEIASIRSTPSHVNNISPVSISTFKSNDTDKNGFKVDKTSSTTKSNRIDSVHESVKDLNNSCAPLVVNNLSPITINSSKSNSIDRGLCLDINENSLSNNIKIDSSHISISDSSINMMSPLGANNSSTRNIPTSNIIDSCSKMHKTNLTPNYKKIESVSGSSKINLQKASTPLHVIHSSHGSTNIPNSIDKDSPYAVNNNVIDSAPNKKRDIILNRPSSPLHPKRSHVTLDIPKLNIIHEESCFLANNNSEVDSVYDKRNFLLNRTSTPLRPKRPSVTKNTSKLPTIAEDSSFAINKSDSAPKNIKTDSFQDKDDFISASVLGNNSAHCNFSSSEVDNIDDYEYFTANMNSPNKEDVSVENYLLCRTSTPLRKNSQAEINSKLNDTTLGSPISSDESCIIHSDLISFNTAVNDSLLNITSLAANNASDKNKSKPNGSINSNCTLTNNEKESLDDDVNVFSSNKIRTKLSTNNSINDNNLQLSFFSSNSEVEVKTLVDQINDILINDLATPSTAKITSRSTKTIPKLDDSITILNTTLNNITLEEISPKKISSSRIKLSKLSPVSKNKSKSNKTDLNTFPNTDSNIQLDKNSTVLTANINSPLIKNNSKSNDTDIDITFPVNKSSSNSQKNDVHNYLNTEKYIQLNSTMPVNNNSTPCKSNSKSSKTQTNITFPSLETNPNIFPNLEDKCHLYKSLVPNSYLPFNRSSSKSGDTNITFTVLKSSSNSNKSNINTLPNTESKFQLHKDSTPSNYSPLYKSNFVNNFDSNFQLYKPSKLYESDFSPVIKNSSEGNANDKNISFTANTNDSNNSVSLTKNYYKSNDTNLNLKSPKSPVYFTPNGSENNITPNMSDVIEEKTKNKDENFLHSDTSIKLNFDMIDSPPPVYQKGTDAANKKNKRKRKEKSVQNENEHENAKRAKLFRHSSKCPAQVEKIAVARRNKDGNFEFKINDPIDELIKKYLHS